MVFIIWGSFAKAYTYRVANNGQPSAEAPERKVLRHSTGVKIETRERKGETVQKRGKNRRQ